MEKTEEGCMHEVFYPKNFVRKKHEGPCNARKYKFKLDPFQTKSVYAI